MRPDPARAPNCETRRIEMHPRRGRNQLSWERDRTERLRAQLARLQQQHQRLQDEHRQSMLSVQTLERELVALKADLVQEREKVVRLTRESPTPVSTVRKTSDHVDQTPRPMAPYGYWASPSGYRYRGRW
jgi:seryl-tRNA synthetase